MNRLLESLKLLRQDMELPEAQDRPVHPYYKAQLDALIKDQTPQSEPIKKHGDQRRAFYEAKIEKRRQIQSFFSESLPYNGDNLRAVVAEDIIHHAQRILVRHLQPDGIAADQCIQELLGLLDAPVANTLTQHLRE